MFNPFTNPFFNMVFPPAQPPVAPAPPPPPPPGFDLGRSLPMLGGIETVANALGSGALALPGNAVRGTLGAGAKLLDPSLGNRGNQEAFDQAMYRGLTGPGSGGLPMGVGQIAQTLPEPVTKFLVGQLFDPINYVGVGIPGKALAAGKLARAGLSADELASAAQGLGKTTPELLAALAPPEGPLSRTLGMLDAFEGKTQDVLSEMFKLVPQTAGALGSKIPVHREIIGGVNPDLTANLRQSRDLTDYLSAISKRSYLKQFAGNLQDAVNQYKGLGGDPLKLDPSLLPSDLAAVLNNQTRAGFDTHISQLSNDRARVEKIFRDLYQGRTQQPYDPSQFGAEPLERMTGVLDKLGIPHGAINSTVDLLKATQTQVMDKDYNAFDKIVKSYPVGDILKDNPLDLTLDRVVRDRAKSLGVEAPTGLRATLNTANALFSEQALQSLSYLITNAGSGALMGALEGVNPLKVFRNLADNAGKAATGEKVFTSDARNLANAIGLVDENGLPLLPHDVSAESAGMLNQASPTSEYTGRGLTAGQRVGVPRLALGGGALGAVSGYVDSPDDATPGETATNTLAGAALGAGAGAAIPTLSKYLLQRFSRGIEDVLRQSAWELGTRSHLTNQGDSVEQIVRDAFANGFPSSAATTPGVDVANTPTGQLVQMLRSRGVEPPNVVTGVVGNSPSLEPDWRMLDAIKSGSFSPAGGRGKVWADELSNLANPVQGPAPTPNMPVEQFLNAVHSLDGMFSPKNLEDALTGTAGVHPDVASGAAKRWQDIVQGASRQGADLSNTINFDYGNLNNLEDVVRQVVPFSTWSMKAFPFFARNIAEHPAILTSALELQRQSQEMRDQTGLTSRVQGTVPMGNAMDSVWSLLLGRPVDTYTNPLRGLLPFSDTMKTLETADQESSPIAKAYKFLTAFGPSANPALEFIARTSGILGTDTPARGVVRQAGPLQGVSALLGLNRGRGIDIEQALLEGEGKVRHALSGRQVTDLTDTAAERRVDELALRDTGQPITSGDPRVVPYLQAKTAHRGPVWDAAQRDVGRERGLRSLVGLASNQLAPAAIVSQEEAQIRGARAGLLVPQELSTQVRDLKTINPMQQVDPNTYRQVQQITQQLPSDSGIRQEDIQAVLAQPVAANVDWLFRAIYEYQQQAHPEIGAYSGSGTPEQRNLQNLLTERRNVAASVPELRGATPDQVHAIQSLADTYRSLPANLRPSGTVAGRLAGQVSQGQDQYRKANPVLDEYLNWLAARRGQGSVEQFINERGGAG